MLFVALPNPAAAGEQHLRVGIPNKKPHAFVDANGQAQGIFVELFNAIAQQEGWEVEYVQGTMSESLARLESGEIDVFASLANSPELASRFDFPEQFVFLEWSVIILPPGEKLDSLLDLKGTKIAVAKQSLAAAGLQDHLEQFHIKAQLVELDGYRQVFAAVAAGKYAAGACESVCGQTLAAEFPVEWTSLFFSPRHVTYAVGQGRHQQILAKINHHLARLKNDPQSIYYQILEKWLPQRHDHHQKYLYGGGVLLAGLVFLGGLTFSLAKKVRRKKAELIETNLTLHRLNQQFQTLLDGIPDHLMLLSAEMKVLWMNRAARRFSRQDVDAPGMICYRQWAQLAEACGGCPVQHCFASGVQQDMVMRNRDRVFGVKAFPIVNEQGEVESVIKLAIDITEKIKLQEDADRKNRLSAVGELSTGVAHEINNPTGLILTNLSTISEAFEDISPLLDDHYRDSGDFPFGGLYFSRMREELPAMLKETGDAARHIRQIVADLKDFARGSDDRDAADFQLNEAVQRSLRLTDRLLHKATTNFILDLAAEPIVIHGNERRMEQVLVNLLANACQALPDRHRAIALTTRFDVARGVALLVIRDEGVGILPEHLPKLATPFFTTRQRQGGTGLGLSVSFGIVKEHNGTIHFASEPGQGTTVTLTLPASIAEVHV